MLSLQPQTGETGAGVSRDEFIDGIAKDMLGKLPKMYDIDKLRRVATNHPTDDGRAVPGAGEVQLAA